MTVGVGKWLDTAEQAAGATVDGVAHLAGDGLDMVGLHGAARTVDGWGDSAADHLGFGVPEKQLGQTDDPKELLHGDPGAISEAAGHLRKFQAAFEATGSGLQRLDHDHWKGSAADAFRRKFTPHPKEWLTASAACEKAADALENYARTVQWAQGQANECAEEYRSAQQAYDHAQDTYNEQVDAYNAKAKAYNQAASAGRDPGAKPVEPGAFDGGRWQTRMKSAEAKLQSARAQRDNAARTAGTAIEAATATAPAEPSFATRLLDDAEDMYAGSALARQHFGGGLIKGAADMVKFVRGLNPEDPYNITHPSMWLDHVSTTAAGLVHSAMHPNTLVSSVVGSGWGTDPGEALGKLTINLAGGAFTGGGADAAVAAERVGVGAAGNVAKDEAVQAGENAAERTAADAADVPRTPEPRAEPEPEPDRLAVAANSDVDLAKLHGDIVWRDTNETLYRVDDRHPLEIIKEQGFQPKDPENLDLKDYTQYHNEESKSAFVSTTRDMRGLVDMPRQWQYEIDAEGGIDVNATLKGESKHPHEQEIAFPGGIKLENVKGWREFDSINRRYGPFQPNPYYKPHVPEPTGPALPEGWTR